MSKNLNDKYTDELFEALKTLDTTEEYYAFFEDLCTVSELHEMSRRWHAATMLASGSVYTDVCETTGLSTATISRVNRCLKYGTDGYVIALERLKNK